jgi:hypothetical protein
MQIDPFFEPFEEIGNDSNTLKLKKFMSYMGPLPKVIGHAKIHKLPKLNNLTTTHPIFLNVDYDNNPAKYINYLDIYKYLKYQNTILRENTDILIKYLNILRKYDKNYKFITENIEPDERLDISKYGLPETRRASFLDVALENIVTTITNNQDAYNDYKKTFLTIKDTPEETKLITDDVSAKINNATDILFKDVAKNIESQAKLTEMFKIGYNHIVNPLHTPLNTLNTLKELKPGSYDFYMCRSIDEEIERQIRTKTRIGLLTSQRSINNANNASNTNTASKTKKSVRANIKSTSPHFKHFGGINGKFVLIARFYEYVIKAYIKYKTLLTKIREQNFGECNTFLFYHNLILNCTKDYIKCSQFITKDDNIFLQSLIRNISLGNGISCSLIEPDINKTTVNKLPRPTENSIKKATKYFNIAKLNLNRKANSIQTAKLTLKSKGIDVTPRIYKDKVRISQPHDGINNANNIQFINDVFFELNIETVHSINNTVIIIYAFIKNILLNPEFIRFIDSVPDTDISVNASRAAAANSPEKKANTINSSIKTDLKTIFSVDNLFRLLVVPQPDIPSTNILHYFEQYLKIKDKSYFYTAST